MFDSRVSAAREALRPIIEIRRQSDQGDLRATFTITVLQTSAIRRCASWSLSASKPSGSNPFRAPLDTGRERESSGGRERSCLELAVGVVEPDELTREWFLMISTHSQRHILQIREIKAHPSYPAR